MKALPHPPHSARPVRLAWRAMLLVLGGVASATGFASKNDQAPPTIWPVAKGHQIITSPARKRVMTQDELWGSGTARHQILNTGGATRTVTLAPIGANGIPVDARFVARVSTSGGDRILFRRSDGELLAFWGSEGSPRTQWVEFTADEDGWDTHVSAGSSLAYEDPQLAFLGDELQELGGFVQPASARTNGYAIRFKTGAPLIYVACRANHPRFRVLADGEVVADVDIDDHSGNRLRVPIDLGQVAAPAKEIEILADVLEFATIETIDARAQLEAWPAAVPPTRLLWIGDSSVETGTHAYPWMAGKLLNHEVWSRSWGHHAQHVADADRNNPPHDAIEEDVAAVDPDVVVISGHFFDDQLPPKEYAAVVGAWFDAIAQASRAETVKIALPSWVNRGPVDRMTDRRASIIAKEARRHGFSYINWQDWIEGDRDDPSSGNAHEIVSENNIHFTPFGNAYIAARFVEQVQRLGLERKIQLASMKRHEREKDAMRNIASADASR